MDEINNFLQFVILEIGEYKIRVFTIVIIALIFIRK